MSDAPKPHLAVDDAALHGATFTNCDLRGARFVDVNLTGARFDDINLTGVTITENCNFAHMTIAGAPVGELLALWRRQAR